MKTTLLIACVMCFFIACKPIERVTTNTEYKYITDTLKVRDSIYLSHTDTVTFKTVGDTVFKTVHTTDIRYQWKYINEKKASTDTVTKRVTIPKTKINIQQKNSVFYWIGLILSILVSLFSIYKIKSIFF